MVARTDRHFRFLLRGITRSAPLYTEMLNAASVTRKPELLDFNAEEHPLVLQLAGRAGEELRQAAREAVAREYDSVNLNCGCPSARAHAGGFGACMMATPRTAADAFSCLADGAYPLSASVKCRLGVKKDGGEDSEEESLHQFVAALYAAGCRDFIIHARSAWLGGLSTAQNHTRPPLNYSAVRKVAAQFTDTAFTLNGGLADVPQARKEAAGLAGAMLGRAVWQDPWRLAAVDENTAETADDRAELHRRMCDYLIAERDKGNPVLPVLRAMARLGAGRRGAKQWRVALARVQRGELQPEELFAFAPSDSSSDAASRPSTNAAASKSTRSSAPSPTPRNRTGSPNRSASATTIPPRAVPSSLVRIRPSTPAAETKSSV